VGRGLHKVAVVAAFCLMARAAPAELIVHEPFEGTNGASFVGSAGGTGWGGPWLLTGQGSAATAVFEAFGSSWSDGTHTLADSGEAGLLKGNTGPVERAVAASAQNHFGDGESAWISYRTRLQRTDRQNTGVTFGFDGGNLVVDLESDPTTDDNLGTIRAGGVDSPPITPFFDTDFFLVVRIEFSATAAENVTVWRDPALAAEPAAGTALVTASVELGTTLAGISINSNGAATDGKFDEIRVGESFADAVVHDPPAPPVIESLTVDKAVIVNGERAEISWLVDGATTISISPTIGGGLDPAGSAEVSPTVDTTYTLTADNAFGTSQQTLSVAVVDIDFSAIPKVITHPGDPILLSWNVSGAGSVSIDQGIGAVTPAGNTTVTPAANTVYTLTASRAEGSVTRKVFTYLRDRMPPNILFIAIDDLKRIGGYFANDPGNLLPRVYPDPAVRSQVIAGLTPHIDQLAAGGVSFMRAYCASPACNPSRAALMTGIRSHKSGLVTNAGGVFFRDWSFGGTQPLADAVTLPRHLRNNDYYAAGTGKIFHGTSFAKSDGNETWDDWEVVTGNAGTKVDSIYANGGSPIGWGQEGPDGASHADMLDFRRADFIATALETGSNGSINISADTPFFLACGIQKPHLPYYATKDLADLFPVSQMTGVTRALHDEFLNDCGDLPPTGLTESGGQISNNVVVHRESERFVKILNNGLAINPVDGDLEGWKDMLKYYFACSALADRAVGRLLEGLENSPYADNTIVILWSDHGYHLGEKMHITKFALWEDSAGVHFVIRDPKYPESSGIKCQRPVNLVDIYPTVCARAALPLPDPRITGHDLGPLQADPRAPWNIPSLCTDNTIDSNMVAMDRFKLIRYKGDNSDAELYDRDADPDEYHNLLGNPAYAAKQAEMFDLLGIAIAEGTFPAEQEWSLESWRHGYFGVSTNAGAGADDADPDGDGQANFWESALLRNPLVAEPWSFHAPTFEIEGGGGAFRFPLRETGGDVFYDILVSGDMGSWNTFWTSETDDINASTEFDHGNGTRDMKIAIPITDPHEFLRLRTRKP